MYFIVLHIRRTTLIEISFGCFDNNFLLDLTMPRSRGKGKKESNSELNVQVNKINKKLAGLEDVRGSMMKLPNGPPMHYRHPSKMFTRILFDLDVENPYKPYTILNGGNSTLNLAFASVEFHSIDYHLSSTSFVITRFYDMKSIQTGSPQAPVAAYGTDDSNRFECLGLGATGAVQGFRIHFPKFIREQTYDVNDKVTPLFDTPAFLSDSTHKVLAFCNVTLYGYSYYKPSTTESSVPHKLAAIRALTPDAPIES